MQTKNRWYIEKQGLQNGYLGFFKFWFFDPKNLKKSFFLENDHKSKIFKFSKTGIYVEELAVFNQCANFQLDTIIFDPQRDVFVFPIVPNDDVIHLNAIFESYSPLTGKLMVPLDCWGDSASETRLCFKKLSFWKIWPFLTFLTWPWIDFRFFFVQMKSKCKITVTTSSSSKMDHKTCVKRHIWKFWIWWPFLTWPRPWPGLNMKQFHSSVPSPGPWSTYGKFWAKHVTFEVTTSCNLKHPILNLWPDLDLTRDLNFEFSKWFGSISSRSFECRLVRLSTFIRFPS